MYQVAEKACDSPWDATLQIIEKKARAGELATLESAKALQLLHDQSRATREQKKRAIAVAKLVVENRRNRAPARMTALELVAAADPQGKAFAAKFEDDGDGAVKQLAKRIRAER